MNFPPFKLERYFARYEFAVRHLLSASDCQALRLDELLALADDECRQWWGQLTLGYGESAGHPLLRGAVASLYSREGAQPISAENVLMAVPQEAILIAMSTLVEPGDHVVALSPAYQSLFEIARTRGCTVTPWNVVFENGAWRLDLDALAASLTPKTRLLVLNFPHNPTGLLPSRRELDAILALAKERELIIFSDEMYRYLEYDAADRLPSICELYERGVTLSGLSKSFGLAGLRVGWLVAPDAKLIERFAAFKDWTTICGSAPAEVLAVIGLRARESIVARNLAIIAANLLKADDFFAAHPSLFEWPRPRAGSVAFVRWNGAVPLDQLCERALEHGVMIVPSRLFDFPGDYFRLGLGRRDFAAALDAFGRAIDTIV